MTKLLFIAQDKHSNARSNSVVNNYRDHSKYPHGRDRENNNATSWNSRDGTSSYKDEHYPEHRVHDSSSNAPGKLNIGTVLFFLLPGEFVVNQFYALLGPVNESQTQDMEISSENSTPTSERYAPSGNPQQLQQQQQQQQNQDVHLPHNSNTGPGPPPSSTPSSTSKILQHSISRAEVRQV